MPRCPLPFASLERALESTSLLIAKEWRDEIYLLLWELGTNILKYGINNLYAPTLHTHSPAQAQITPNTLESSLHISTDYKKDALELVFAYSVALPRFYIASKPVGYTALLALPYAKCAPKRDRAHHHSLGHKVIKRYARKFCYNAPQLIITSARYRTISITIKGQYLAIYHSQKK